MNTLRKILYNTATHKQNEHTEVLRSVLNSHTDQRLLLFKILDFQTHPGRDIAGST
jgi:hypothetical protein